MTYDELEAAILRLIRDAGDDSLRSFGADTVVRLMREELLLDVALEDELDEGAAAALGAARENVLTTGPGELHTLVARTDEGVRTDGDMDPALLIALSALEHWTSYVETGDRDELYELAIRSVERVDFEVSADLGDFLAKPGMAAEFERIERLLTA